MKLQYLTEALEFAGAAYKDLETGEILGPDGTHAAVIWSASGEDPDREEELFNRYADGKLVAGFLTTDHRFLTRKEAARLVGMKGNLDSDDSEFQNNVDSSMWESVERILGAAFMHVPSGYITPPDITHSHAMFDPGLKTAAKKVRMNADTFVARYVMDRSSERREDDPEFLIGFVSDQGRFYTRDEATAIAKQNPKQPKFNDRNGSDRLDSTDLHWQNESAGSRKMAGAAMIDHETGKIYGPGDNHYDVMTSNAVKADFDPEGKRLGDYFDELMWDHIEKGRVEDGFVDDAGKWYTRTDAAKAVRFDEPDRKTNGPPRDWLDAWDLKTGFDTIHEEAALGYSGYAINHESQQLLLSRIAPAFEHTSAHHITHLYGVPEEMPPHATTATVIAVAQNDRAQAAIVEINGSTERPNGQTYHITISYDKAGGASAKDSNQAIQTSDWTPVPRFTLPLVPFWKPGAVAVRERAGVPQATSKTLYHGTTVEIARKAMQHGLYPSVGDFVREFYGSDVDNLVFATDKSEITKATSAMNYHVARQLGVSRHRLTSKQLYQNGAILVIRSGMDTNDHLYHRATDDHLDYDDHPEQVEPGDYYGYEQIDPDYMLTGVKLKRFLTRLGLAQDKPNIMHPDQQQNVFIKRGQVQKPVREDTESDLVNAKFLIQLVNAFQEQIRKHLQNPIYNSDNMFVKLNGQRLVKFRGAQFGWPGEFKSLWILLRDENSDPQAAFHSYVHPDKHKERMITFAVLPPEEEGTYDSERMDVALSRMVSSEWGGIMLHELQHAVQDIRDIPMNGKGSYTSGTPNTHDYYNSPVEFDAYYQQLARGYHALLAILRDNPKHGVMQAERIGFDRDFKISLDKMLPKEYDAPEWGMWYYARQKQNRRLTKRLYGLHQAIVKELDNMRLHEDDDQHQQALDNTGFWGSAGAGCIIMAADTKRILLPKRSEWVQEPGTWGTWGGAIDSGEDPQEAALREVEEEAGYSGGVQKMIHLFRFQSGKFRYDTFLAIVSTEFTPNLNWETEQADWFELGDFPQPLHFGLAAVLKDGSAMNKLGTAASR